MEHCIWMDSPVGRLLLTAEDNALTGLYIDGIPRNLRMEPLQENEAHPVLQQAKQWLEGYFSGQEKPVTFLLNPRGTPFQQQVWRLLREIPWGKTRTYGSIAGEMADILGKERMSAQAVGGAVGRNPISILIPCHRVVGAAGQLTGYAWGVEKKQWLLRHEGAAL